MQFGQLKRRQFISLVGGAAAWPLAARAQPGERMKRLGILTSGFEADDSSILAFRDGIRDLGWTEGRNIRIDTRVIGTNDLDVTRAVAAELIALAPDVILARPATAVQAVRQLTSTIPIVFVQSGDPVQSGLVQSLSQPSGNATGFFTFEPSINTRYLQLLKDLAPRLTRVAVMQAQTSAWRGDFAIIQAVARSFSVASLATLIRDDAADIERAIAAFAREPNGGLILPPDIVTLKNRRLIVALAAKHRLPAVYYAREFVNVGGLLFYGPMPVDYRRVASYVDRILRGAKPADLPVQAPIKYNFVINLTAARALDLEVPATLLALADEVID
jgi:putative ABC transport system substrate-binding protein